MLVNAECYLIYEASKTECYQFCLSQQYKNDEILKASLTDRFLPVEYN